MPTEGSFVIRMDRRKTAGAALLSFVFVLLGVWILRLGDPVSVMIGVIALLFFGSGTVLLLWGAAKPPIVLEVDSVGVHFGGLIRVFHRNVPWEAIKAVRIFRFKASPVAPGMRMLGFVPTDPHATVWTQQRLNRMNSRLTGTPASISDRTINLELEQLVEVMREFRPCLELEYGWGVAPERAISHDAHRLLSWRHR